MKTRKALIAAFLCALAALSVRGQGTIQNPLQVNITAQSTDCSVANSCAWQFITLNAGQTVVTLSGTFSGTFLVEETNNGTTWTTAATLSSAGTTTYTTNGFTAVRVRCSAYTSGTAVVTVSTGTGGANISSGGSFASLTGGTNTTAAMVCGTGCSLSTSGTGTITATAGGSPNQIQYNNAGAFGGASGFTFNSVTGALAFNPGIANNTSFTITSDGSNTNTFVVQNGGTGRTLFKVDGGSTNGTFIGNALDLVGVTAPGYLTTTNCAAVGTTANPSVASCGNAVAGSISCAATETSCKVNTTLVTANSEIFISQREDTTTGTQLGVTCNVTPSTVVASQNITAVVAGTSFTFAITAPSSNPDCFSFFIVN